MEEIEGALSDPDRELFAGRDRVDYIVLVDDVPGSDTLGRIKQMLSFEFTKSPKSPPLTLEGGFQVFLESHPGVCEASPEVEVELDFEFEDSVGYDEDIYGGLVSKPKPKDLTSSGLLIDIEEFSAPSIPQPKALPPGKAETLQMFHAFHIFSWL